MLRLAVITLVSLTINTGESNKPAGDVCPSKRNSKIIWPATPTGETAIRPCPSGYKGNATRHCGQARGNGYKNAMWNKPNLMNCDPIQVKQSNVKWNGNNKTQSLVDKLHKKSKVKFHTHQDLNLSVSDLNNIIRFLKKFNGTKEFLRQKNNSKKIIDAASNLLDPINTQSWLKLQEESTSVLGNLVEVLDDFGVILTHSFNTSDSQSVVIRSKNIAMKAGRINPGVKNSVNFTFESSSVSLATELFSPTEPSSMVTIVYSTLSDFLQIPLAQPFHPRDAKGVNVSSAIVSSTVKPKLKMHTGNKELVKLVLKNRPNSINQDRKKPVCVSWNPEYSKKAWSVSGCSVVTEETNVNKTTCVCSHLTLFTALMEPFHVPIARVHKTAIEFISIIGCSISLVAISITFTIIMCHRKKLKSPQIDVLLNICMALGCVCFLVIIEQPARYNRVLCKLLAILLHYFLLTVFFWMLCEGILLYSVLARLNMTGIPHSWRKAMYCFGWGFPLLLVVISLWATELRGYGDSPNLCWLSIEYGVVWAFVAPALVVITVNFFVLFKTVRLIAISARTKTFSQSQRIKTFIRATFGSLPLLGCTWGFGILTFHSDLKAFKYIFAICNSLQGAFIFVFHCLLDEKVRKVARLNTRPTRRRIRPLPVAEVTPRVIYAPE